jgi:DNA-directed RNA polymerase specialized sigma24 family protein
MGMQKKGETDTAKHSQNSSFSVEKKPALDVSIDRKDIDFDIEAWYKENYFKVLRICMKILNNHEEAENATHDVFNRIQVLKNKGKLVIKSPDGKPDRLLSKMAKYTSFTRLGKIKREYLAMYSVAIDVSFRRVRNMEVDKVWYLLSQNYTGEYSDGNRIFIDGNYGRVEAESFVKTLLEDQDEKMLEIFFLKYRDELSPDDIGKIVGLSRSGVYKRLEKIERLIALKLGGDKK